MRKLLFIIVGILLGSTFTVQAVSIFTVPQGGTGAGSFTAGRLLYGSGINPLQTVATTTASCSGSASCTSFVVVGSSPITITATAGVGTVSTSTNETAGFLSYWTSNSATPALLGKIATTTVTCTGIASCNPFTVIGTSPIVITDSGIAGSGTISTSSGMVVSQILYATSPSKVATVATTTLTATTPLSLSNPIVVIGSSASTLTIATTSTSLFTGSAGQILAFLNGGWIGVATTTFNSPLTYSNGAVSCATCNTSNATVSSVALSDSNSTLTIGGTPITTTGTLTATLNLAHANFWTALQNFTNASTSQFSATSTLFIPNSASQIPTSGGQLAQDTTDNQLKLGTGSATVVFDQRRFYSFGMSTSTTWTGSTTLVIAPYPVAGTLTGTTCTTDTGTVGVDLYYGPTPTHLAYIPTASTTANFFNWTSSNTPGANASSSVTFGTPTGGPTSVSCTATFTVSGT